MEKFGYRKLFEDLDPYYPQPKDINKLAAVMSGRGDLSSGAVLINSAAVNQTETTPIPAGYTYLGQFIIHDISFDEKSARHKREDLPWEIACPEQISVLRNLRKPNFDLETIYGYETPVNDGEIPRSSLLHNHPLPLLKLGVTEREIGGGTSSFHYPCDLPRGKTSVKAEIVDERNDENLLLAQTQVAFIKFHNAIVAHLAQSKEYIDEQGRFKTAKLFDKARELTIRYYQKIVLTDFLPRIIQESVIKDVENKAGSADLYYQPFENEMFMPLEFAVGAFRFGHSMIKNDYNLNIKNPVTSLGTMMAFTGRRNMRTELEVLARRLNLPTVWVINWNLFYEINEPAFNRAEPINTELVFDLMTLPPEILGSVDVRANSLAALDLYRGRRFGLPTGQDIASKYPDAEILGANEIRKAIASRRIQGVSTEESEKIKEELVSVFGEKTPLWFYILAEAELQGDGRLGTAGSRIVAETIIQLLYYSEYSILRDKWIDGDDFLLNKVDGTFGMKEMFAFISEMTRKNREMLYPKELYPLVQNDFDELDPLGKG